jgi:hypothetical protein
MAYTQKPGRGNNAKTGNGLPSPFKQEDKYSGFGKDLSKGNPYEKWDTNNPSFKTRAYSEKSAKLDSIATAKKAMDFGIGKREAGKMGNIVANETRKNFGQGDLNVTVKTVPGGEEYKQKIKPGINPRTGAKVKVVPPTKMKVSKKTAYDIKEASNQKLKASARKNYAENAQAAMKNKMKK